jgi:arylesterase/paraoxonase
MRVVWVVSASIALCLAYGVFDLLRDGGSFKTIEPHFAGTCRPIPGMPGPEDIVIRPDDGLAFVSSTDRRGRMTGGAIHALDLNAIDPEPVELTRDFVRDFEPHGLSWFRDADGRESLFVVSHPAVGHVVEIFDIEGGALVHRETIEGELLRSPNDVFAVGRRKFYATNDHRNPRGFGRTLEDFFRRAISDVVYFDGMELRVVAEDIAYPNGITGDAEGASIFVASTTGRAVLRYDRDRETGALSFRESYDAGTGVDNLDRASDGRIWIGAHPNMLAFLKNARDPKNLSPSQVLRLDPGSGTIEEIFLSRGDDLSTSSVAATFGDRLVIGSVFENHVLLCEMGGAP